MEECHVWLREVSAGWSGRCIWALTNTQADGSPIKEEYFKFYSPKTSGVSAMPKNHLLSLSSRFWFSGSRLEPMNMHFNKHPRGILMDVALTHTAMGMGFIEPFTHFCVTRAILISDILTHYPMSTLLLNLISWFGAWKTWSSFLYMELQLKISIWSITIEQTFFFPASLPFFVSTYLLTWLSTYVSSHLPSCIYESTCALCLVPSEPMWTTRRASLLE